MRDQGSTQAPQLVSMSRKIDLSGPYFTTRDRLDDASLLVDKPIDGNSLQVASYRRDIGGLGMTQANPASDAFMMVVPLRSIPAHSGWRNGRHRVIPDISVGALTCMDWRESWVSDLPDPFHSVHFLVPQVAFNRLTEELGVSRIQSLSCSCDGEHLDPVMHGLAQAMTPVLAKPHEANRLFTDHIISAALIHMITTYGGVHVKRSPERPSLTSHQIRIVAELMLADFTTDIGISELAATCNLSVRHFQRAFIKEMGIPPHRWRTQKRVEKAKQMLEITTQSLVEVGLACGFADQSHFTRVFSTSVGISPAIYRRARRS